jgi:hypothetical protein
MSQDAVSRVVVAAAQADKSAPVFVGTVWMLDELEQALLLAAKITTEIKAARSTQDLPAMHEAAARLRKAVGQANVMALSLQGITTKHTGQGNGH